MDRRYRKTIIAGNWKMNLAPREAKIIAGEIARLSTAKYSTVVLCVPALDIVPVQKALKATRVHIGAQNCNAKESGAYTGEVSAKMLADAGVKYCIVGHSERRGYYGETDEQVGEKVRALLANNQKPIVCVGETEAQRLAGVTENHIALQVKYAIAGLTAEQIRHVVIAYEPIWAIGTGKTATPADAENVCKFIRATLREIYGARVARAVSILYGGSMNEKNAPALLAQPDIDGGLIGGASLKPEAFATIVEASK